MKAEYINAFLDPAVEVIESTLGIKATIGNIKIGSDIELFNSISAIIGLTGDLTGTIIFGFSEKTAESIASQMLKNKKLSCLTDEAKEALGELTNMIIGNVTGSLSNLAIKGDLTPPTIVEGKNVHLSLPDVNKAASVPIETELGNINMNILIRDHRSP